MKLGKPITLFILGTLLAFGAYSIGWNRGESNGGNGRLSQLFSSDNDLEDRVKKLEDSLRDSIQIQSRLFDLVEDLRRQMEQGEPEGMETRTAATAGHEEPPYTPQDSRQERYRKYREMQRQRLIDAGLNPDRAEFILDKQERFQYEHMQLTYEYRHLDDKSTAEANALRDKLETYSNPRKMFEHELSPQEFELYLEVNGGRQELQIDNIVPGTPAADIGLKPGDKIVSYNGERVFHSGDLRSQIYRVDPGKTVPVEIQREGSSSTETIYVPSGPLGIQG